MDRSYVVSYEVDKEVEWYLALGFEVSDGSSVSITYFDDGTRRAEIHTQTEEGYRYVELRECEDDCDQSAVTQRDYFAEAMGY